MSNVKAELQRKLKEYVERCGSQRKAADNLNVSPPLISRYLKGTYDGDIEKFEQKLEEMFTTAEAAENLASKTITAEYVPTSISQAVFDTIHLCHLKGGIAVESGDAGIGKTMAAKQYVKEYPNSSIYISINPCLATLSACLKLICQKLRISTGRKDDMWIRICDALSGERKVLIIDEAQHLPVKTIEAVRAFIDADPTLGICMIGNIATLSNNGNPAYAQIQNRTKLTEIRHTKNITLDDIAMLCPRLKNKKELELMLRIAHSMQGIRGAVNVYSNALDNEDISYNGLRAMASAMQITTMN